MKIIRKEIERSVPNSEDFNILNKKEKYMKKIIFSFLILFLLVGCTQKVEDTNETKDPVKETKEKTLAQAQPDKVDWLVEMEKDDVTKLLSMVDIKDENYNGDKRVFVIKSKANVGENKVGLFGIPCSGAGYFSFTYEPVGEFTYRQVGEATENSDGMMENLKKDYFFFVIKNNKIKFIDATDDLTIEQMDNLDMSDGLNLSTGEAQCR